MWRFYEKGKNGGNRLRFISAFDVYNDVSLETGVQVFSSPSVSYRYMTANIKVIKTQSEPKQSDFSIGSLGEDL